MQTSLSAAAKDTSRARNRLPWASPLYKILALPGRYSLTYYGKYAIIPEVMSITHGFVRRFAGTV